MKRLLLAAIATAALAAPLSAPAFAEPQRGYERHDNDHHGNRDWRDNRRDARYDARMHNGYYVKNVWHFGPPPASAYRSPGFQLGWHAWRKGDRLGYYNTRYSEIDWRARHLKAPPRGYHYVQDNNGDVILAAIATGLIASIIANNG